MDKDQQMDRWYCITAKAKYSVNMTKLSLQKHSPKMVLSKLISGSPCD